LKKIVSVDKGKPAVKRGPLLCTVLDGSAS